MTRKSHRDSFSRSKNCDSGSCSVNFVKYVLQIYNVIFFLSGFLVAGVALWTIFCKHEYISLLTTSNYVLGTYTLLVAGILAIFGGFLGCCGVWREQRCMILGYIFILLLVFLLEAVVGSLSYLYQTQIKDELNLTLSDTFMQNYGINVEQTGAIDSMQQKYSCCGAIRFEDWRNSTWIKSRRVKSIYPTEGRLVPDSCCISMTEKCGLRDHPNNIPYTGCIYKMTEELENQLSILGAIGLGICGIQIFGMILSCCVYVKLKDVLD